MRSAQVVIGANYGDEGKGLVTDALAASDTVVVRFNGGAQAGHTVVTPQGYRHVFSHVGSGAFHGAPTLLARDFIVSPNALSQELTDLAKKGVARPLIMVDPRCIVTTPVDVFINRTIEQLRGAKRHGSVGHGINETVERSSSDHRQFRITTGDLFEPALLRHKLKAITGEWLPARLEELGAPKIVGRSFPRWINERWVSVALWFAYRTMQVNDADLLSFARRVVFEGAQGLALDQNNMEDYPHITRSNTGAQNVGVLAQEAGIDHLELVYVTRWYLTRHGNGPLPGGNLVPPFDTVYDNTNTTNEFQGALRYALMDARALRARVHADVQKLPASQRHTLALAVTCLDQWPKDSDYSAVENAEELAYNVGARKLYLSAGPTRETFAEVQAVQYAQ